MQCNMTRQAVLRHKDYWFKVRTVAEIFGDSAMVETCEGILAELQSLQEKADEAAQLEFDFVVGEGR